MFENNPLELSMSTNNVFGMRLKLYMLICWKGHAKLPVIALKMHTIKFLIKVI